MITSNPQETYSDKIGQANQDKMTVGTKDHVVKALREALKGSSLEQHSYLVGGSVRDLLLGRHVSDYDLCVELPGGDLALAKHLHAAGLISEPQKFKSHDLITCRLGKHNVEISQSQLKHSRGDKATGESFGTLSEDAFSRDFTINSLYLKIADFSLLDPCGRGLQDLKNKIIAPVTTAQQCFEDDPLRMLRALRFVLDLGFEMDLRLFEAIRHMSSLLGQIPVERVSEELMKMFRLSFSGALDLTFETGILATLAPPIHKALQGFVDKRVKTDDLCKGIDPSESPTRFYSFLLWILITDFPEFEGKLQGAEDVDLLIEERLTDIEKVLVIKQRDRKRIKAAGMVLLYLKSHTKRLRIDLPDMLFIADLFGKDLKLLTGLLEFECRFCAAHRDRIKQIMTGLEQADAKLNEHSFDLDGYDLLPLFEVDTRDYLGIVLLLLKLRWQQQPGINKDDLINNVTSLLANPAIREARLSLKNCRTQVSLLWDLELWETQGLI